MTRYWNDEFEAMPWADLERYWLAEMKLATEYLRAKSAFYSDRLRGVNTDRARFSDLTREIPFLDKEDLRAAQQGSRKETPLGLFQAARSEDIVQVVSSSGTSGRPVFYGITRNDLEVWRDALACFFYTAGIRREDVVGHAVGTAIFAGGSPYYEGLRHIGAMAVWAGGQTAARVMETIRYLHCTALVGTTSFDLYLGDHFREAAGIGANEVGMKKVLGGGEPGLGEESIRRRVKEAWGAETVREIMGLADVLPGMWAECEEESGMHFTAPKCVVVELIDPASGDPLPWEPGVCGEAVYTTIRREATPVLRYRSADYMRVEGVNCRCGRTSPKVRCIGRVDDMLIYKGMNVFPSAVRDVLLKHFEPVLTGYIQIVKDHPGQVLFDNAIPVDVEIREGQDRPAQKKLMESRIRELLNVRTEINPVVPGTLQRTEYKTPLVRVREKKPVYTPAEPLERT